MGLSLKLVVTIPDTVRPVEILRVGASCYPNGADGEPTSIDEAIRWAFSSTWGVDRLAMLGVTWTTEQDNSIPLIGGNSA